MNSTTAQLALDDLSETDTNVYCCVVIDDVMYEVGAQHMVIGSELTLNSAHFIAFCVALMS